MSNEKEQEQKPLSMESSLNELFEAIGIAEHPTRVVPVTILQEKDDTRLLVVIRGEHETASVILAQVMTVVQDLFDQQEQAVASNDPKIARV